MGLFLFLTVVQALVAAALVGVVLMQRSEGGGLGIGGSPTGALGARGAADFLTRATKWLAIAFVVLSIILAGLAVDTGSTSSVSTTLDRSVPDAAPAGSGSLADPGAAASAEGTSTDADGAAATGEGDASSETGGSLAQ